MDISRLKVFDWVAAGAGLIMAIASFGPWYTASISGGGLYFNISSSVNGWHFTYFGWLMCLGGLAAIALVVLRALPNVAIKLPTPFIMMGIGGVSALLAILRVIVQPSPGDLWRIGWGLWLALVASLVLAGAGFMKLREQGPAAATTGWSGGQPGVPAGPPQPGGYGPPRPPVAPPQAPVAPPQAPVAPPRAPVAPPQAGPPPGYQPQAPQAPGAVFCTSCGAPLPSPDAQLCTACGAKRAT